MNRRESLRTAGRALAWLPALALVSLGAIAQPKDDEVKAPIHFGDVVLSNYLRGEVHMGKQAWISGPDSTVDATDQKTGSKGQLQAAKLTAFMAPRPANVKPGTPRPKDQVERIEAEQNVRFVGSRPTDDGKGAKHVRVSGSKLVYHKLKSFMEFDGPVKFYADEPSQEGPGIESVQGVSDSATYDEAKRIVVLTGHVSASVRTPDGPADGSTFSGDEVTIDMSEASYVIGINNESRHGKVKWQVPVKERPTETKKDKK